MELNFFERHVLRKLISKGHDSCVPHDQMPEPVLESLRSKGIMEKVSDHYRLTPSGREINLAQLR